MASITPANIFTLDEEFPSLGSKKPTKIFTLDDKAPSGYKLNFAAAAATKPEDIPMVEKFIINSHGQVIEGTIDIPPWLHVHFINKLGDVCILDIGHIDEIRRNICGSVVSFAGLKKDVVHEFYPNMVTGSTMENYGLICDEDPDEFQSTVLRCFNNTDKPELILNINKLGGMRTTLGKGIKGKRKDFPITLKEVIEIIRRVKKTDDVHIYCLFCRGS